MIIFVLKTMSLNQSLGLHSTVALILYRIFLTPETSRTAWQCQVGMYLLLLLSIRLDRELPNLVSVRTRIWTALLQVNSTVLFYTLEVRTHWPTAQLQAAT
jgi:hypothetical protein